MDNYPTHLAPVVAESGGIVTPFSEWWERVQQDFPGVPENLAQYWIHEHWGHSPFSFLPSQNYRYTLVAWPSPDLWLIRSGWDDFDPDNAGCVGQGEWLIRSHRERPPSVYFYKTAAYLIEHRDFPAPIIILDNRDNHERRSNHPIP